MIGVVLHERRTTREARSHHLHCPDQRRGLPVAFGTEAVAVCHQTLHRDSGQLLQAVQVLERVGECFEVAVFEKSTQAKFDARCVPQGRAPFAGRTQ